LTFTTANFLFTIAIGIPHQAFGAGPPDFATDGHPSENGKGNDEKRANSPNIFNFDNNDKVRYMCKYKNQQGKSDVARLGKSGKLQLIL